ncbi:alpha/beta fold hydrolase [Metabacillus herbersteinensis]|uniref:Alpha/beta fold hydrolase n=1 Tax=Metabacillus herbersteinensis TaxID=283816 RepID=A0ABV6GEB1_9BACI
MVIIEKHQIQDIVLLHVVKDSLKHTKTPFVIFIHGFTSAKEHNLHYAYLLAEKGIRVVLPDAEFHGERAKALSSLDLSMQFWDIVINEIHELNLIKEHFQHLIDQDRIGVVGTSMGGITTLGALTQYRWIKVAVSLMGSPYYTMYLKEQLKHLAQNGVDVKLTENQLAEKLDALSRYDLSLHKETLAERPLLFWHGEKDEVVPFAPTYQFYKEILPLYEQSPENIRFIADPAADHKVSREGLLTTAEWFEKHL